MNKKYLSKPLEEEKVDEQQTQTTPSPAGTPEYSFEGYTIAINEKIVLMPVQPVK
jgi:hypothetical protein